MSANSFAHLEDAQPVPGAGPEGDSEGVEAGDRGRRRVRVRDVDEDHLGEGLRRGLGGLCGARHAELQIIKTDDEATYDAVMALLLGHKLTPSSFPVVLCCCCLRTRTLVFTRL